MYLDIFLAVLLGWAAWSGWRNGFLKEAISCMGLLGGIIVAALIYYFLGDNLRIQGARSSQMVNVGMFFVLCIVMPLVLSIVANMLTKALRGMRLGIPNSLLGMAFCLAKYVLLASFVFNAMEMLHIMNPERTEHSILYSPVRGAIPLLTNHGSFGRAATPADTVENKADTTYVYFNR